MEHLPELLALLKLVNPNAKEVSVSFSEDVGWCIHWMEGVNGRHGHHFATHEEAFAEMKKITIVQAQNHLDDLESQVSAARATLKRLGA